MSGDHVQVTRISYSIRLIRNKPQKAWIFAMTTMGWAKNTPEYNREGTVHVSPPNLLADALARANYMIMRKLTCKWMTLLSPTSNSPPAAFPRSSSQLPQPSGCPGQIHTLSLGSSHSLTPCIYLSSMSHPASTCLDLQTISVFSPLLLTFSGHLELSHLSDSQLDHLPQGGPTLIPLAPALLYPSS